MLQPGNNLTPVRVKYIIGILVSWKTSPHPSKPRAGPTSSRSLPSLSSQSLSKLNEQTRHVRRVECFSRGEECSGKRTPGWRSWPILQSSDQRTDSWAPVSTSFPPRALAGEWATLSLLSSALALCAPASHAPLG